MVCLSRPCHVKCFNGYLLQNLLVPFLNTLSHISLTKMHSMIFLTLISHQIPTKVNSFFQNNLRYLKPYRVKIKETITQIKSQRITDHLHYVKSVRIRSYFGPYSVQMRENTDQNNSKYGHFLRSAWA